MKLTAFILLMMLLQVSIRGSAQNVTLHLKQASLQQIFRAIHEQTGFQFFYNSDLLDKATPVDIHVTNAPLNDVLNTCFKNQPVTYEIISHTIVVKEKTERNEEKSLKTTEATHEFSGKVINQEGQPVPGITVMVKGTNQVTATNEQGEFAVSNVNANTILVFTAVNVEKLEMVVGDHSTMALTMQIKRSLLDDIQIIGYGSTTRKLNTGSLGSITSSEIQVQPVSNPLVAAEGLMAGVQMTVSSGEPAAPVDVKIRGQNTAFSATSFPLYIVDGVAFPYNVPGPDPFNPADRISAMNSINPADIENITVLKDADATSVYGSRGANGVILITTKKGKAGPTVLSLDMSTGFSKATRLVKDYLNTPDYLAMRKQAFVNDGIQPTPDNAPDLTVWSQTAYTDFQKEMIGSTGIFSRVHASLSGGDDRLRYLLSGAYTYNTGIVWGTNYDKRSTVHLNIENNSVDKRFQMSTSVTYTYDNIEKTASLPTYRPPPNFPKYDSTHDAFYSDPTGQIPNPWFQINRYTTLGTDNLVANTKLSYLILPNLKITLSEGYAKYIQVGFFALPSNSIDQTTSNGMKNSSTFSNYTISTIVSEPQIDYNIHIGNGKLQMMAGGTWQDQKTSASTITGNNYSSDALIDNIGAASSISSKSSGNTQYKYESVYGRVNYNWQDRYLLNGNFRRDGSSRFGEGYKFGNFWSAGAGWIFSNEEFFRGLNSFFNFGKIRGSYGTTGNDQIGDYQYLAFYSPNAQPYNGTTGIYSSQFTNSNYRWEETDKTDVGLELGAFNSRILLTVDYYNNKSKNLLTVIPLAPQSGYSSYTGNSPAVVQNRGWELTLNTVNIRNRNFSWLISFNITFPKNTLLAFPNLENSVYNSFYKVGKSINSVIEIPFAGIRPADGVVLFKTANGTITDGSGSPGNPLLTYFADFQYIGNTDPSLFGGFGNIFTYKNFELNVFFRFSNSHTVNSFLGATLFPVGAEQNASQYLINNVWTKPGQNASQPAWTTSYNTPTGDQYNTYVMNSSANYVNNSYIRLKTLSLTWNMPQNWSSGAKLSHVQIYAEAQNLFTITSYIGLDPESTWGVPLLKTVSFGLRANL